MDKILELEGFGNWWRRWVRGCVTTANFSILMNGKSRVKKLASSGAMGTSSVVHCIFVKRREF